MRGLRPAGARKVRRVADETTGKRRSAAWFGKLDKDGFIHRSWVGRGLPTDVFDGRPIIGICNTWSELTPCNLHFRELAEHVKRGVWEAGGLPFEFPVMSEALEVAYPSTTLQTCLVHLIRNSLDLAGWQDRKALAGALRAIYTAVSADAASGALDAFAAGAWGRRFPTIVKMWRQAWEYVIPFFAFPPEVRRVIYTTNALESVHARVRKIIKTRGHFPTDEAATKLIWLALRNITAGGGNKASNYWHRAMQQFAILYEDRFTTPAS